MKVGVTGSRTLTINQQRQVRRIFRGILSVYGPEDEFHHGNANGVDKLSAAVAESFGMKVIPHHPKRQRWKGGYKERNKEIVESVDFLIAVHSPDSTTGGTLWTYQYAEEQGKRCDWIELTD